MASPSPRSHDTSRVSLHLALPRVNSLHTDASDDTTEDLRTGLDSLQSRLEVVDRDTARRKFARYGREYAHVNDLLRTDQDRKLLIQSSMLLQENGGLAARLDDVMYLLDGLLGHVKTQKGRLAQTLSVLELIRLLQVPKMLQAIEVSCQRRQIQCKMKELLLTKLSDSTEAGDKTFRVSLAVLVYILSRSSDADGYFDQEVLDAMVCALKQEVEREGAKEIPQEADENVGETTASASYSVRKTRAREKKCLKRKQSSCQQTLKAINTVGTSSCADKGSLVDSTLETVHVLDESCWIKLDELLCDHELFYVEGKLQVCVVSALSAALHILLQVDGFTSGNLSNKAQCYQRTVSAQYDGAVEDTFQLIRTRKCQLVRNGAIDVLVLGLAQRVNGIEAVLPLIPIEAITLECTRLFNSVGMLLSVFDQATFLAVDVQRYISKKKDLFVLLLKLVRLLSELSWGVHARKRWEVESKRMSLAVEVLLTALRVLTNLTHHNLEAANHVLNLGGMQLLPGSFSQLRRLVAPAEKASVSSSETNKWEFDACLLLLSVMVNSIELSEENRNALATASCRHIDSACDLFTRFFLAKLQSYKHLIDSTETEAASGTILIDKKSDDWNPEDVILGGCASLLLGYLMKGSSDSCTTILNFMPDCSPQLLLRALSVFAAFHSQIDALSPDVAQSILHVEKVLESCQRNECDTYERGLLRNSATKEYPDEFEGQYNSPMPSHASSAVKSEESGCNLSSVFIEESLECKSSGVLPSPLRVRTLKNVCSTLDDSDEDDEPHRLSQDNVVAKQAARAGYQSLQAIRIQSLDHTPLRTSCGKRVRAVFSVEASPASHTRTRTPLHDSRSSPTAIRPDGSLASPVVARLLKRTRELVHEFDVEFATLSRSVRDKKADNNNTRGVDGARSPCMTLTMNVTCRNDGSDILTLSQDVRVENCTIIKTDKIDLEPNVRDGTSSKRKVKARRIPDGFTKMGSYEYMLADMKPSTPLRTQKTKTLLRTPTKDRNSPGFYRSSPSLNLTPTKTTPLAPLRFTKSAGLLRTSLNRDHAIPNQPPLSVSPRRRKAKLPRAPAPAHSSSIFDFTA